MQNVSDYILANKTLSPANLAELTRQIELTPAPSRKLEAWKYFPLKSASLQEPSKAASNASVQELIDSVSVKGLDLIVFVNGFYMESASAKLSSFTEIDPMDFSFNADEIETNMDLTTIYAANTGYELKLENSKNVHIVQIATNGTSFAKNKIHVQDGVEACVLESFVLQGGATISAYSEIEVDKGAHLHYYSHSVCGSDSKLFTNQKCRVHGGNMESLVLDTDPGHIRRRTEVDLLAENGNIDFKGFYLVNKKAVVNHKLDINHLVPNCESTQLFKGILDDSARVIFDGLVFVEKDAQGTNTEQLNKSTLLSNTAEVDTKPQLEIYADDVKCAHGATLGGFNREEIFYLQSRAISLDKAIQMMAYGFAEDVFKDISLDAIHDMMTEQFVDRFSAYEVNEDVL